MVKTGMLIKLTSVWPCLLLHDQESHAFKNVLRYFPGHGKELKNVTLRVFKGI